MEAGEAEAGAAVVGVVVGVKAEEEVIGAAVVEAPGAETVAKVKAGEFPLRGVKSPSEFYESERVAATVQASKTVIAAVFLLVTSCYHTLRFSSRSCRVILTARVFIQIGVHKLYISSAAIRHVQ